MTAPQPNRCAAVAGLLLCALASQLRAAPSPAAPPHPAPPPLRPSAIVLVTVDALRADRVSFDGYRLPTTPFLDRLAKEGVVFERTYATSSWTPPTMASIFTGVPPMTHGVVSGEIVDTKALRQPMLPESLSTIAELVRQDGFRTLGVASNRHLALDLGFGQGFDRYFDPPTFLNAPVVNDKARMLLAAEYGTDWRQTWRSRPLFLWLHYFDPHDPYFPYEPWIAAHAPAADADGPRSPAGLVMRDLRQRFPQPDAALAEAIRPFYDSEVRRTDQLLGDLWKELGPDGNVLFIFTADHGEEIVDHGGLGHSQSLYDELTRIPLFFWWPRGLPAGVRIAQPVSALDILPTILDLLGQAAPAGLAGRSLAPLWRGTAKDEKGAEHRPVFLELAPPKPFRWAVVDGARKLIVDPAAPERPELYDLSIDPGEMANLAAREPAEVERLRGLLRTWARQNPRAPDQRTRDRLDDDLRQELEALGYLGSTPPAAPAPPQSPPPPR
ncbi:MAG: sulfatase [Thermoanaerobaculia bacterium]